MTGRAADEALRALDSPRTLIVGRNGRLARAFAHLLPQARVTGRGEIDIASEVSVRGVVASARPQVVINCVALTDMLRCETDPAAAWAVNVEGVRYLASASGEAGARMVHFSSDYALDPLNEYARTKRASEGFADLTVRAKIYDGSHWAWRALREGRPIHMTTLEHSNPLSTTRVAAITCELLSRGAQGLIPAGTFERLSLWEIGRHWAAVLGAPLELVMPIGKVPSPLPRPADTFLETGQLARHGIAVPSLVEDAMSHARLFKQYAEV